jgi:hypothetical protein
MGERVVTTLSSDANYSEVNMLIILQNEEEWYDAIAAMVQRGLTFTASKEGSHYHIKLTGGF